MRTSPISGLMASALVWQNRQRICSTSTGGGLEQTIPGLDDAGPPPARSYCSRYGIGAQELFDSQVRGGTPYGAFHRRRGDGSMAAEQGVSQLPAIR